MSYDLEILTSRLPKQSHLVGFIQSSVGLALDGRLGSEGNMVVRRITSHGVETIMELWGPDKVEPDDLESVVSEVIRTPKWLVKITVPGATKDTISLAEAMAVHIARECKGAVFDPQANAVIWPKVSVAIGSRKEESIRVVTLNWYLPRSQGSVSMAETFLQVADRICPQAFPVRFGAYHPLQGKLKPGEAQPFLDAVEEIVREDRSEMLELKSTKPCFGGMFWIPSRRNQTRIPRMSNYVSLNLDFDGRVIEQDSQWCEKIASLFTELAKSLKAFYAHAYVERGVYVSRGGLGYSGESEHYPQPMGRWQGIPSVRYWLTWFGEPYRSLIGSTIDGPEVSLYQEGIFVRSGSKPMDFDQLQSSRLGLPVDLVSEMKQVMKETKFPSGFVHRENSWETTDAKFIPNLS